jgi:hypothetical protein
MSKNGLKLLDLTARAEHKSKLDKSKEPTKFFVGSLTSRQMFAIMSKYGNQSSTDMANCAIEFVRYGLKDVKGELRKGFKLEESNDLGWYCQVVCDNYLDSLPIDLLSEISTWVTGMSRVGNNEKKA